MFKSLFCTRSGWNNVFCYLMYMLTFTWFTVGVAAAASPVSVEWHSSWLQGRKASCWGAGDSGVLEVVFLGSGQRLLTKEHQKAAPVVVSSDREQDTQGIWCIPSAQEKKKSALWLSGQCALACTEVKNVFLLRASIFCASFDIL